MVMEKNYASCWHSQQLETSKGKAFGERIAFVFVIAVYENY
jgi:hypothetical protein